MKTSKPASFDGSYILAAAHFLAAGNVWNIRRVVQLGASGGLVLQRIKTRSSGPKFNNIWV